MSASRDHIASVREIVGEYIFSMNDVAPLRVPPERPVGNRVAMVSLSWAEAGVSPDVREIAVNVLRNELDLVSVESSTTGPAGASPDERARDLIGALADTKVTVVRSVVGRGCRQLGAGVRGVTTQGPAVGPSAESAPGKEPCALGHQRRDGASATSARPWVRR